MNGQAGKGDKYRPVNWKKYAENYDRIFRKTEKSTDRSQTTISTGVRGVTPP